MALGAAVGACSTLDRFTKPPELSPPGAERSQIPPPAAARLAVAPRLDSDVVEPGAGSLWRSGPQSLFGDRRARRLGDIVTVLIEIDDKAEMANSTERSRDNSENVTAPALLGAEALARRILPAGAGLDPAIEAGSSSSSAGEGSVKRREKITIRIAATVVGVLPNGHLVVEGSQEVRVNYELRDLQVAGVIRPEDISRANVITYEKIADARIAYGGRGSLSDVQRIRYGQQVIDMVSPF
jgi:flagellar L-ring protein precursor FlgH